MMARAGPAKRRGVNQEAKMNKTFVISVVAMFVVASLLGFVVHGLIIGGEYAKLTSLFRGEADFMQHYPAMAAANLLFAIGFTWIYRQGREERPFASASRSRSSRRSRRT
jgi:hypothetical protein